MHSQAGVHGHSNRKKIFQEWNTSQNRDRLQSSIEVQKKRKNRQSKRAEQYLIRSLLLVQNIQQILTRKDELCKESQTSKAQLARTYKHLENFHIGKNVQPSGMDSPNRLSQRQVISNQQNATSLIKVGQNIEFDYEMYYQQIRRKKKFLKKMEVFSLSNLINYNSNQVQIQFVQQQPKQKKLRAQQNKRQHESKMDDNQSAKNISSINDIIQPKKSIMKKKQSFGIGQEQSSKNNKIITFQQNMHSKASISQLQQPNQGEQSKLNLQSRKNMSGNKLREILQSIKKKRNRLQETLVMYQYNLTESQIVPFQTSMQFCLAELSSSLSQQQMINIHYLMIHQLKLFNQQLENYKQIIQIASKNLKKFQAIDDSILLMKNHTKQMHDLQEDFEYYSQQLTKQNSQKIVLELREKMQILDQNLSVYKSNKQNFARYSPQTNIQIFQISRRQYINELNRYQALYNKMKAKYLKAQKSYQKKAIDDPIMQIKNSTMQMKKLEKELQSYREILNKEGPKKIKQELTEKLNNHQRIIADFNEYKQNFARYSPENYVGITEAKRQFISQLSKYQTLYDQLKSKYRI